MAAVATAANAGTLRRLMAPGWIRAAWMTLAGAAFAFGLVVGAARDPGLRAAVRRRPDRDGDPARRAARLPGRHRRLRLLGPLDDRPADPARGPLRPRRPQLEGLLPGQHRPQGDRHPVHGHRAVLHARRRRAGRGDPGRAGAAGPAGGGPEHLQRPVLGPRLADDLPGRDPDLRGARELRAPADDRRAGHGVPAPERAQLLAAAGRRGHDDGELPGPGRAAPSTRAGRPTRRCPTTRRWGRTSSRSACSSRAPRRS